jgi:preprotein translocase subunit YajC
MPDPSSQPLVLAMAQPGAQPNIWVQLFPFAVMLLIFYVIVLLPMRRRQKKVQDFQSSLKVGDKVITTGGIYGLITRLSDGSVQVQIADRVRIEISRAAIAGYQGQDPVVQSQDSAGAS